jgi:hypothetical protein
MCRISARNALQRIRIADRVEGPRALTNGIDNRGLTEEDEHDSERERDQF